ncbi:quinone oxidoreductase family protein [Nocardia aurantiaca]|uniref:Zinc-binding dehydrogenase n=1 Tax=Nocardia aurantiaca TaxID=2675850 RepID=A0A6I3KLD1_9NOCA|nr:zinc-binding dehydrogenase [Nocardia aurantiaca]MTE11393.1 zinc-binding dehydrogenase [Nocardia aurantiaca]
MRKIQFSGRTPAVVTAAELMPGPGRLLVRTELAGVHLGLVRMLQRDSGPDGGEIVGTVVAAGPDLAEWVGKRVGGVVFEGAYAEFALAAPQLMSEIPAGVDAADALALVRGGVIALGLLRTARFTAGESVMVTGAASGVGHLAVQLARALGASRVIAAVGSADKADFLRGCGADEVVTYDEAWTERVDIVLDGVGGEMAQRCVETLGPNGRLIAFSAFGGAIESGSLLGELKTVTGFSMGLLSRTRADLLDTWRVELWNLLAAGRIRPRHTVLPLAEMDAAIALIETRRNLGRVAVCTA